MALRFIDSFNHYTTSEFTKKWTNDSGGYNSITTGGRFTNRFYCSGGNGYLGKTLDSKSTWIMGFAWMPASLPTSGGERWPVCAFRNGANNEVTLDYEQSGRIIARRGEIGGTYVAQSANTFSGGTWYYLEVKVKVHGSTGTIQLRVNGVQDTGIDFTGNTSADGATTADNVWLGGNQYGSTGARSFCDFYLCDTDGSGPTNNWLGDIRVESLFPSGNGTWSGLVGSDSNQTDNYLLVDETAPATADYVGSSTPGDMDTYTYGSLSGATGTVYGVQILPYAAKTNAGTASTVSVARLSGGTEEDGAAQALSTTPIYMREVRETKPGGGSWSITDVNGAEFGVKVGGS